MNSITRKRKFKNERNYVYTYSATGVKYLIRRNKNKNLTYFVEHNVRLPIIEQKISLFRKLLRYFTKVCFNQ
jgi:hypothetical protein